VNRAHVGGRKQTSRKTAFVNPEDGEGRRKYFHKIAKKKAWSAKGGISLRKRPSYEVSLWPTEQRGRVGSKKGNTGRKGDGRKDGKRKYSKIEGCKRCRDRANVKGNRR